jgi:hypothetical protein
VQKAGVQFIDLSHPEGVYVILQAKPNKKATTHNSVGNPADLVSEMVACLDEEMPLDATSLPLPIFFPQSVPHIKYQRLTTIADHVDIPDLARRLWEGGRLVLKSMTTDRRIRFGNWARAPTRDAGIPATSTPGVAYMDAPLGMPLSQARRFFSLLGKTNAVDETTPAQGTNRTYFRCQYAHPDSATLADGVTFDSTLGELHLHGHKNETAEDRMHREVAATMHEDTLTEGDLAQWWKLEAGKFLGAAEALEQENHRVTAANLSTLQSHTPSPPLADTMDVSD